MTILINFSKNIRGAQKICKYKIFSFLKSRQFFKWNVINLVLFLNSKLNYL